MLFTYPGQILIGWLFADLLSGIVHWIEDRVLRMDTPILCKAVVIPNRVHHSDQLAFTSPLVKTLQEIGIIQSPRHHSGHHRTPTDTRYCILTDWLNPVLDRIELWATLERLLEWLNLKPNPGKA
jgi:Lipid desaturase domain